MLSLRFQITNKQVRTPPNNSPSHQHREALNSEKTHLLPSPPQTKNLLRQSAPLVPRISLNNQLPPRKGINSIRKHNATKQKRRQVVRSNFECLFGDFTTAVPFFDVFILFDVHGVGEGSIAHFSPGGGLV